MKLLISLLLCGTLFYSCQKNTDTTGTVEHTLLGRYTGTFSRSGMETVPVNIFFKDRGRYEGTSGRDKYPAICRGSFSNDETSVTISDSCTWTADFDWTLIFNGTYSITYKDAQSVRIYRTNGTITDEYLITKDN